MKKLIKKVLGPLAPLLFAGSLFVASPQPSFTETSEFNFSGGVGVFNFQDEIAQEVYGVFPRIRVGLGYSPTKINQEIKGRMEGGVDLMYASKKGQPLEDTEGDINLDSSSRFSIFTIRPTVKYYFGEQDEISLYLGLSFPWSSANEKIEIPAGYFESATAKVTMSGMGFEVLAGIHAPINESLSFFLEGAYNNTNYELKSIELNGESWELEETEKNKLKGLSLEVGLKKNFQ